MQRPGRRAGRQLALLLNNSYTVTFALLVGGLRFTDPSVLASPWGLSSVRTGFENKHQ
jgi:hypothetical protein